MHKKLSKLLLFCHKNTTKDWRLWTIGITCLAGFGILVGRFYKLQVLDYTTYSENLRVSTQRQLEVIAERGEIFDRYGEPLAVNEAVSNLYYTPNMKLTDQELNTHLLQLIRLLEGYGDTFVDEVPISQDAPFKFNGSQTSINEYTYQIPYENEAHRKILLTYTPDELIDYLRNQFQIPMTLSSHEARQLIALRSQICRCTYKQYESVLLARNVSDETLSYLKENSEKVPNLIIKEEAKRCYPLGNITSNILGYTHQLTTEQFNSFKEKGYNASDVVGQMGIEKTMENSLRGHKGVTKIEVDNMGRKIRTVSEEKSCKGKDVYLSLDANLQKAIYKAVEERLSQALITKLKNPSVYDTTGEKLLNALINCHGLNLNIKQGPYTSKINDYLKGAYESVDPLMQSKVSKEALLTEGLQEQNDNKLINEVLLALEEQGVLKLDEKVHKQIFDNKVINLTDLFISQLEQGILTPGQMNEDPFSAVAVMTDIKTGEILAMVDYPSYDNNKMVTDFNSYWQQINADDRSLLWQRSLKTLKAPGSTFKMITAIAGLEEKCITPQTIIEDTGVYKEVGKPYPKCWYYTSYGKGHGKLDLKNALADSCNYYFYEVAHRLEEQGEGIQKLSKYMTKFGLTEKTGVELEEASPCASVPQVIIKNKINDIVTDLGALDEKTKAEHVVGVKTELMKQLMPSSYKNSSETLEKTLYEQEVNQGLEPILQDTFMKDYDALISSVYDDLSVYIGHHQEKVKETLTAAIIDGKDESESDDVAQAAFYKLLDNATSSRLDGIIQEELVKIPSDTFLDAYEKALTKVLRRVVREGDQYEEVKTLNKTIKHLNRQEEVLREEVLIKIKQNLLNTIVNNLLDGVELNWTEGITVRTAIGQGYNAFSPLQVLRYITTLANGEMRRPLTVIRRNHSQSGEALNLKPENIKVVQEGMLAVTAGEEGTAKGQFDNIPIKIAAKTGTAQEGYHEHSYIVAFAPYEAPEVALIVAVYNADGLGKYSTLIANDMLLSYFGLQNKQERITLANTWME